MEEVSGRAAAAAHSEARGVVRRRDGVDGLRLAGAALRPGVGERAGRPHGRRLRRRASPLLRSVLQVPAGPPRPSLSQPSVLPLFSLSTLTRRSVSPLSGPTPQESVSPMHSVDHVRKTEEPANPATSANPSTANPASTPVSTVSMVSTMGEAPSTRRSLASLASLLSSGTLSSRLAGCVR